MFLCHRSFWIHVVWAPDSHFDEFGRYEYSLREGFYDYNDVEAYKKFKLADGAVVLGLLQFVRNKDWRVE